MCSKPYLCPLFPLYDWQVWAGIGMLMIMLLFWVRWLGRRSCLGRDMPIENLHSKKIGRILVLCSFAILPTLMAPIFEIFLPTVTLQHISESELQVLGWFILIPGTGISLASLIVAGWADCKQLTELKYAPDISPPLDILFAPNDTQSSPQKQGA